MFPDFIFKAIAANPILSTRLVVVYLILMLIAVIIGLYKGDY